MTTLEHKCPYCGEGYSNSIYHGIKYLATDRPDNSTIEDRWHCMNCGKVFTRIYKTTFVEFKDLKSNEE